MYLLRPAFPKYTVTLDVSKVLSYLDSLQGANDLSLKLITFRLLMLLLLLSGQRLQSVHLIDIRNMEINSNIVIIRIGDLIKQSRPNSHL